MFFSFKSVIKLENVGVQDAFYFQEDVFTLSFHAYEKGFYPGTGSHTEIGDGLVSFAFTVVTINSFRVVSVHLIYL